MMACVEKWWVFEILGYVFSVKVNEYFECEIK